MVKEPINITDADFEAQVLQNELPVVVDFWAPWCGPCKMVAPTLDKLADEYSGKVVIAKVIPTMMFFKDGKLVHRQVGALPEPMLRDLFEQFVNLAAEATEN